MPRILVTLGPLLFLALACQEPHSPSAFAGTNPAACPVITTVDIVSRIGDRGPADADRKFPRADQQVTLYARITVQTDGKPHTYTDAPASAASSVLPASQWPAECPIAIQWSKVEAEARSYNNAYSAPPAEISYQETPWRNGWAVTADVHPTLMHDDFPDRSTGLGTMRYKATATTARGSHSSPGLECRRSGALCPEVHAIAYRLDDTYLGHLYELFNTPYIYGSKRIKGGHQSDLLVGSDCADFAVYGKRRQRGRKAFGYTYTGGLYKLSSKRWRVSLDEQGYYVDRKRRRLSFGAGKTVRPGDLINFEGGHVGVLVRDDGDGLVDLDDTIAHTLFREPELVPIKDCRWGQTDGKEILRLRKR